MKLYFHINLLDDYITDPEGMTFANLDDAIREAEKAVSEMAFEAVKTNKPFDIVSIRICDASGKLFAEIVSVDVLNGLSRQ